MQKQLGALLLWGTRQRHLLDSVLCYNFAPTLGSGRKPQLACGERLQNGLCVLQLEQDAAQCRLQLDGTHLPQLFRLQQLRQAHISFTLLVFASRTLRMQVRGGSAAAVSRCCVPT